MDDEPNMAKAENVGVAEETNSEPVTKPKKHRKWPWVLGSLIFIFIVIPILVLGWLGFVPGLSKIMGATTPRDLGVRYTQADYQSYQTITGGQFLDFANAPDSPSKPGKKTVFADPKPMAISLTQEEITATWNSIDWAWMPLTNTQIRFGNGTVEMSGNLNTGNILDFVNFIGGVGYSESDINKALRFAKFVGNPAVYINANTSVTNNVANIQINQATIGRFNAPDDIAQKVINNGINSIKNGLAGQFSADSVTFTNGQLHFVGTSPTTVYVKHN